MSCVTATDHLSALHDGELPPAVANELRAHVSGCVDCQLKLESLESIARLVQSSSIPVPESLWEKVRSQRDGQVRLPAVRTTRNGNAAWVLAMAASLLVAAWLVSRSGVSREDHHAMHAVFGKFVAEFERHPRDAGKVLLAAYSHRPINDVEASEMLGGPSVTRFDCFPGCVLRERQLIDMPCCACVQSVYDRENGSPIIIFEHKNRQPEWFVDTPTEKIECPEGAVCRTKLNLTDAITLTLPTHSVTIFGSTGVEEGREILRKVRSKS